MIEFTIEDYQNATHREFQKRLTTYPKIITKMKKRGIPQEEIEEAYINQEKQVRLLRYSSALLRQYPQRTVLDGAFLTEILNELMRELKMRKSYYPRLIRLDRNRKSPRMTPETAAYEIAVWESLTRWFAKEYLDLDELPTKRRKKT